MNKIATKLTLFVAVFGIFVAGLFFLLPGSSPEKPAEPGTLTRTETKIARNDYFFNIMRDPATNSIPDNIRSRELSFARNLPGIRELQQQRKGKDPSFQAAEYIWEFAGPIDVGGRTRALGIDQRNSNIILAGAVSGGLWKSTDGGNTWQLKTQNLQSLSVTSLAQHPSNPDTWFYSSGEFLGNSASSPGATYYGTGIYKSTDNGETWNQLVNSGNEETVYDSEYDFISRIVASPTTGTVFFSSNGFGVYRSTDGQNFSADPVIGSERNQIYADVAVASDGTMAAVISDKSFDVGSGTHNPGVFISTSDGTSGSWTEITPSTFPSTYGRSVLAFAPSNPDILYILTHVATLGSQNEDIRLHKIDLATGTSEDRSDNIPDFGGNSGSFWSQSGYDLDIAVKPDDENFVMIGGTNLYRGRNGFATTPSGGYDGTDESQKDEYWIGGYNQDRSFSIYPNHHPDQHITAFDPTNPNRMISGHDGGLSVTTDITAAPVSWSDLDNGYTTSQYYTSAIPAGDDDNRLLGGMQDNGSPFFRFNGTQSQSTSNDISFGDGGYAYFSSTRIFVSQQNGRVIRYATDPTGAPIGNSFNFVHPSGATGQLFIHPYVVDPNDETIMYYPSTNENATPDDQSDDKSVIYRNTQLELITNQSGSGTSTGWERLTNVDMPTGYNITSLEVSSAPANILYFAGSSDSQAPVLKRLNNASGSSDGEVDVSPSGTAGGAYIKDIALNPVNADEVLLVMSNYNITGLYHTSNGGSSWTAVEGNLTGSSTNPGPSLRSAVIIPAESGTKYVLATSTGIYSTQSLNGSNTTWGQESLDKIGFAVTEYLSSRRSDGDIAAGTHGRGMFKGTFQGSTDVPTISITPTEAKSGEEITIQANNFQFSTTASENEVTIGGRPAEIVNATSSALTVIVPRAVVDRDAPTNTAVVSVTTDGQTLTTDLTVLPPQDFNVSQNFPNPFNPSTQIPFDLPEDSKVTISVYDILGQKVKEPLKEQLFNAGTYNTTVDLTNLASGIYIYRIVAESNGYTFSDSRKMTLIK